jgi:hypothetical protein
MPSNDQQFMYGHALLRLAQADTRRPELGLRRKEGSFRFGEWRRRQAGTWAAVFQTHCRTVHPTKGAVADQVDAIEGPACADVLKSMEEQGQPPRFAVVSCSTNGLYSSNCHNHGPSRDSRGVAQPTVRQGNKRMPASLSRGPQPSASATRLFCSDSCCTDPEPQL